MAKDGLLHWLISEGPMPEKKHVGKNGKVPPIEGRFSASNQPSPAAKSAGLYKWHERNRLKDNVAHVFAELIPTKTGEKVVAMEALARRLRNYLLEKNPTGMTGKQVGAALKLMEMLAPSENKVDLTLKTEKISETDLKKIMAERVYVAKQNAPGAAK